jgi:predicted PurR-regulated permease PerM
MKADLEELRITRKELEKLTGLDISEAFIGHVIRPVVFRSSKRLVSFLLTEVFIFGLILIFCLPIGLLIGRSSGRLTSDAQSTIAFLQITIGASTTIAALWNLYIWQKSKELQTLGHLLDEVDKHNEILQAVDVIDELGAVQHSTISLIKREEVVDALRATRESLVCALMTEKILRKHQRFIARRHELFTNIEANLATLQTLKVNNQANEYGRLLNEALEIGMSVHREMQRFK